MPVMLLRNLDRNKKLCNGTRMKVVKVIGNVLLASSEVEGEQREVLIPRIPLEPKDGDYPFRWTRRQFPSAPAFAMTINKSQGQTIRGRVGVFLPEPVFSARTAVRRGLSGGAPTTSDSVCCTTRRRWTRGGPKR